VCVVVGEGGLSGDLHNDLADLAQMHVQGYPQLE